MTGWLDGQVRETAGKRKTKNSTSLAEGEKDLKKAQKEYEKQAKREQKLKEKEEQTLNRVLVLSWYEAKRDGRIFGNLRTRGDKKRRSCSPPQCSNSHLI